MHQLAWKVDEMSRLIESGRKARVEMQSLIDLVQRDEDEIRASSTSNRLSQLKRTLHMIVKGYFLYRRRAATHVLVVMISTEARRRKPYALPVQCIPYASLKDSEAREILNAVVKEMTQLGMKVAG